MHIEILSFFPFCQEKISKSNKYGTVPHVMTVKRLENFQSFKSYEGMGMGTFRMAGTIASFNHQKHPHKSDSLRKLSSPRVVLNQLTEVER